MTYERYQNGTPTNGADPGQVQSDLAAIRAEMDQTLDALSAKLAPRQLIDQIREMLGGGSGGRFAKNLASSVENNPIPLVMMAGGFAYLLYSDAQRRRGDGLSEADGFSEWEDDGGSSSLGEKARELGSSAKSAAQDAASRAQGATSRAKGAMSGARERAAGAADHAREGAQQASRFAGNATQAGKRAARKGQEMLHEQPLVLAGLGVALGAAIAGSAPVSRREKELMGDLGAEAIDTLRHGAQQTKEHAREIATAAGSAASDAAKREVAARTPSSESPSGQRAHGDESPTGGSFQGSR